MGIIKKAKEKIIKFSDSLEEKVLYPIFKLMLKAETGMWLDPNRFVGRHYISKEMEENEEKFPQAPFYKYIYNNIDKNDPKREEYLDVIDSLYGFEERVQNFQKRQYARNLKTPKTPVETPLYDPKYDKRYQKGDFMGSNSPLSSEMQDIKVAHDLLDKMYFEGELSNKKYANFKRGLNGMVKGEMDLMANPWKRNMFPYSHGFRPIGASSSFFLFFSVLVFVLAFLFAHSSISNNSLTGFLIFESGGNATFLSYALFSSISLLVFYALFRNHVRNKYGLDNLPINF